MVPDEKSNKMIQLCYKIQIKGTLSCSGENFPKPYKGG
jgi:hypothetical protein